MTLFVLSFMFPYVLCNSKCNWWRHCLPKTNSVLQQTHCGSFFRYLHEPEPELSLSEFQEHAFPWKDQPETATGEQPVICREHQIAVNIFCLRFIDIFCWIIHSFRRKTGDPWNYELFHAIVQQSAVSPSYAGFLVRDIVSPFSKNRSLLWEMRITPYSQSQGYKITNRIVAFLNHMIETMDAPMLAC